MKATDQYSAGKPGSQTIHPNTLTETRPQQEVSTRPPKTPRSSQDLGVFGGLVEPFELSLHFVPSQEVWVVFWVEENLHEPRVTSALHWNAHWF